MHEMSTMVRLVNQAVGVMKENGAAKALKIVVEVGEMTDIVPDYLHKYFPAAIRDTPLDGAELETHIAQAEAKCLTCGTAFHPEKQYDYRCPACGGIRCRILKGRSVVLSRVVIDDGEG
jgi:hydrogenase nickel incorporation protein HypA/HybF